MARHLNPLEKEFLIHQYKRQNHMKLSEFCSAHNVSDTALKKWLRQYDEGGLDGLARADSQIGEVLHQGIDRTEESYKREIIRLRIQTND